MTFLIFDGMFGINKCVKNLDITSPDISTKRFNAKKNGDFIVGYQAEIILKQYLYLTQQETAAKRKIYVLGEQYKSPEEPKGTKVDFSNSDAFKKIILRKIDEVTYGLANGQEVLLLVPISVTNHHVGAVFLIKKTENGQVSKRALYIDPFGNSKKHQWYLKYYKDLEQSLSERNFVSERVAAVQQSDGVSCGIITTASMMMLIDKFIASGEITCAFSAKSEGELCTDILYQAFVSNELLSFKASVVTYVDCCTGYSCFFVCFWHVLWEKFFKYQSRKGHNNEEDVKEFAKNISWIIGLLHDYTLNIGLEDGLKSDEVPECIRDDSDEPLIERIKLTRNIQSGIIALCFVNHMECLNKSFISIVEKIVKEVAKTVTPKPKENVRYYATVISTNVRDGNILRVSIQLLKNINDLLTGQSTEQNSQFFTEQEVAFLIKIARARKILANKTYEDVRSSNFSAEELTEKNDSSISKIDAQDQLSLHVQTKNEHVRIVKNKTTKLIFKTALAVVLFLLCPITISLSLTLSLNAVFLPIFFTAFCCFLISCIWIFSTEFRKPLKSVDSFETRTATPMALQCSQGQTGMSNVSGYHPAHDSNNSLLG